MPEIDVPDDVAAALTGGRPEAAAPAPPPRHSHLTRRLIGLAAAVILVVAGIVALASLSGHEDGGPDPTALVASAGVVGTVTIEDGAYPWITMTIDGGVTDGGYTCRVVLADGSTATIGTIDVSGGRGAWSGPLSVDAGMIDAIQVVDHAGRVVAATVA